MVGFHYETASHFKIANENREILLNLIKNKEKEICAIEDVFGL
jgi:hypothetical protein